SANSVMEEEMLDSIGEDYHVFINHRGPDVKKTLASLIYHALTRSGLRVFLDKKELRAGDSVSPAILSAIHSASVHIAIFSKRYAESAWCLNELIQMLQSQRSHQAKVIPVFCDVQPSDLRYIDKGIYAQAFCKHIKDGRVEIGLVERWRDSLKDASHISGLEINMDQDDLGEFVNEIVEIVLKEIRMEQLDVAMHPVGLDQAAKDFHNEIFNQNELSESSSTMVVGIVGLGGSGKSTLVKHFYNSKLSEFRRSSFLADVGKKDLTSLQKTLLTDLLGCSKLNIENTSKGRRLLRDRLRGFPRVLIVFDGIDDTEQLENLLLVKDVLTNGSLILVTSRDRNLLVRSQINILYDVKLLSVKDAQQLFCQHAFHQPIPLRDFEYLVAELVDICGGFPLALKILAGQLCGNRYRNYWMRQLQNFQTQMPDNILQGILKSSYESLKYKEKEAFLDIAHFLDGEDKDLAVRVLEGLVQSNGLDCLYILHQKCLVEFEIANVDLNVDIQPLLTVVRLLAYLILSTLYRNRQNYTMPTFKRSHFDIELWRRPKGSLKIRMHSLVRELARQMGREQSSLRLCCRKDTMISTQLQSKPFTVRGIRRDEDEGKIQLPLFLRNQDICGLKLLVLQHSSSDLQTNGLSGDLVWLRMRKFNLNAIFWSRLQLSDLRVLELTDVNSQDLYHLSVSKPPSQLRELTVTCQTAISFGSISSTGFDHSSTKSFLQPAQMGSSSSPANSFLTWLGKLNLKNLVKLVLKNIEGMSSLPIKFEELRNLRHVDLSGWDDLKELPSSFTELSQLQYLALRDCSELLLPDLGKITTLEYLDIGGCYSLQELPRGTIAQRSLKYLNLVHTSMKQLPENLGELENLEQLYIGSDVLTGLPSSLTNLSRLIDLILYGCTHLCDISKSVEQLMHLEKLGVYRSRVSTLPEDIVWKSIKVLHVEDCFAMNEEQLNFQIQASVNHGELALKAPHDNRVSCLTNLIIRHSPLSKVCIPEAKSIFPNLEIVDLSNNESLTEIEGLPGNSIRLNLEHCPALKTLTCLSNLTSLKYLNVSGCGELETMYVGGLSSIQVIKAEECWKLQNIEGLEQLQKLSHFQISTDSTWRDILTFPCNISSAILWGGTVDTASVDETYAIARSFEHVTVRGIPPVVLNQGFPFTVKLEEESLEGAILICLVAHRSCVFEVKLLGHAYTTSCSKSSSTDDGNTYRAHMLMWTKDSEVFKDLKFCNEKKLYCNIELLNPPNETKDEILPANGGLKKGWVVMAENLDFCKQFLTFVFHD
ncbi:hypothetical protein KI387_008008, partial [Taxus chinensis]